MRAVNAGDFDDGNGEPNADAEYEFEGNITTPSDETGGVVDYVGYIVSTANPNNGTIDVNLSYALPGMVIKITAVPKEGYELSEIVVTDGAGNKIGFTKNDDGTYSFEMPNNQVYVAAEFAKVNTVSECSHDANCPASRFYDLELTAWYHDGVHYCVERGLMIGTSDVAFSPDASTTRGMIVAVLHRLENQPVVSQGNPFTDIKYGSYYEDAIAWAAANGIVEGYGDGSFEPDANITREQMATILYRYADYKGYDISVGGMSLYEYEDAVQISSYAVNAMQWANTEGLIEGRGNGNISPKDDATRAEIAAILMRFCENIAG